LPIDEQAFSAALADESSAAIVRSDASAAAAAGLKFTPMVLINGRTIEVGR